MRQLKFSQDDTDEGDMCWRSLNTRVLFQSHCCPLLHILPSSNLIRCLETSLSFYPQKIPQSSDLLVNIFSASYFPIYPHYLIIFHLSVYYLLLFYYY